MKIHGAAYAICLALACTGAKADSKPADEISGCVERAKVEKYISENNFAELLRGSGADGKTYAVWTSGTRVLILSYLRPADDKMDDLKTICVSGVASGVSFNLYVIEKLVSSAAGSLEKK